MYLSEAKKEKQLKYYQFPMKLLAQAIRFEF